ncbi:MAG: sigma-70 family RNA polymerase sigma factor [Gammaproteobacteria bacterium]
MTSREKNGATDGFLQVFLGFRRRLARAVARIVQPADIEDIVQETFLRCFQASARTEVRHPRSFMLTTARNLALNHVERADNRLVRGVDAFDESAVPLFRYEPRDDAAEVQEEFVLLCRAVRTLPAQCRRAFVLKKVYGMNRKEIASYMGISESTVQNHIAKGMAMCAEYLEGLLSPPRSQRASQAGASVLKQRSSR